MARNKKNVATTDNSDLVKYPAGRIKDNSGVGDGTEVNEKVYGDIHEFFAKLMRLAGITYNELPDNETNGYQLVNAVKALASKNDYVLSLSLIDSDTLSVPIKLSKMLTGEQVFCKASADLVAQTEIIGSLDTNVAASTVNFIGGNFKQNDYLVLVKTLAGVDIVRLVDGATLDTIAASFGYLKAANQTQEDAGAINTVASTPLGVYTAFALRVIGAQSSNFLATQARNGLMSISDKTKLDGLGGSLNRYGTITVGDVNTVAHGNGFLFAVSGQITNAVVSSTSGGGEEITVTLGTPMQDQNYDVQISVESLGTMYNDMRIYPVVWKKISASQFRIYVGENGGVTQNIKLHVEVIQR